MKFTYIKFTPHHHRRSPSWSYRGYMWDLYVWNMIPCLLGNIIFTEIKNVKDLRHKTQCVGIWLVNKSFEQFRVLKNGARKHCNEKDLMDVQHVTGETSFVLTLLFINKKKGCVIVSQNFWCKTSQIKLTWSYKHYLHILPHTKLIMH